MARFRLIVNNREQVVDTEPGRPLLEVLREDCKLTGTKYGCGEGQCRACTVLVDGRPAISCVTPVRAVANRKLTTIEGLAHGGQLHRVQEAFLSEDALQCGYCVPGMILRAVALLEAHPQPSEAQILEAMDGNLCRCCGYPRILAAVRRASHQEAPSSGGGAQ